MNAMKLFGLVSAFETQLSSSEYKELSFEERVGLLVDAEWTAREQRKLSRRLRAAKLRYPACLENVNFQAPWAFGIRSRIAARFETSHLPTAPVA